MIDIFDTDSITEESRDKIPNGTRFNKCEECQYTCGEPGIKKGISYYERHKKVLCDECVDEKDGHPWIK